jgi:chromosomal replication initiator protein
MTYWTAPSRKMSKILKNDQKHARQIIEDVCDFYGLTIAQVKGKFRLRGYVKARFVAIYIVRKRTGLTLKEIGRLFYRDHTSIIHALRTIEEVLSLRFDNDYQDEIKKLMEII